jgi:transglutaminase-like putative cysteine protease
MLRATRRLRIRHTTRYAYDAPIQRSLHRLHLRPVDDWKQNLLAYQLLVRPQVPVIEFEDVFGNRTQRFEMTEPYMALEITAESLIEVIDTDPFGFARLPIKPPTWPLVWMPSERTMLAPYLNPAELPDTQLHEIYDYAMGFVTRNHGDLMETLFAMNLAFLHDFEYLPGCTDVGTTAYQVFVNKAGVCQDFTNLFITMARLLGVPARYVCGYIYTGNSGESRTGSDQTHAWIQLYIPNIGWKDFDPTNGILPQTDHVRVAHGRKFADTSPTSGTLYGKANETMTVDVEVTDALQATHASVLQAT